MSGSDALAGGIGYVVPAGGLEMTGVLLTGVVVSLLLQPVNNIRLQRKIFPHRRKRAKGASEFLVLLMLDSRRLILFMRDRLTGNAILTFNPPAQIDKLAPFGTERTKRIIFPVDWFTAGWALH